MNPGPELKPEQDDDMDGDRQQYAIPPGEGGTDDELVLIPIFEVEMYQ